MSAYTLAYTYGSQMALLENEKTAAPQWLKSLGVAGLIGAGGSTVGLGSHAVALHYAERAANAAYHSSPSARLLGQSLHSPENMVSALRARGTAMGEVASGTRSAASSAADAAGHSIATDPQKLEAWRAGKQHNSLPNNFLPDELTQLKMDDIPSGMKHVFNVTETKPFYHF